MGDRDVGLRLRVTLHDTGAVSEGGIRYGRSTHVARFLRSRMEGGGRDEDRCKCGHRRDEHAVFLGKSDCDRAGCSCRKFKG